ncbi:tyrosine-type recombinase/integrase [Kocuria sp.]|uniref:tyrosine-type recombinase/integrase n=1 Tax=Kocuria sp. TaxID=1871328 RepID=UPI0026DFE9C3|nr:site-specific integrase [Kocuria sp.]MDO5619252.1 site-specific integrase [Kocuria sp.]
MASIRKRPRKDGTVVWAVLWRDADTGRQTSRAMPTEKDAQELRDFLNANNQSFALAAQAAGRLRSTAPSLDTAIASHISQLTGVLEQTRAKYRRDVARWISPTLGAIPVDRLTRTDVADWLNSLPLAGKTKRNHHGTLSAALSTAVQDGLIPTNVAKGLKISDDGRLKRQPVFLSREELDLIAENVRPHYRLLFEFYAGTGLRLSEGLALDAGDILTTGAGKDRRAVVNVYKAWKDGPTGRYIGTTKTKRGRRTVTLSRDLSEKLLTFIATADDGKPLPPKHLLFTTPNGGPIFGGSLHEDAWIPVVNKLADQLHDRPRIHDLRHSHASWLIAAGIPLTIIQRRLGHESIKTTSDLYGHLADGADAAAAAALD